MRLIEYIESCLNEWPDEIDLEGSYKITEDLYFFTKLVEVRDALEEEEHDFFKGVVIYEIFRYQFKEFRKKFDQNDFSPFKKSEIDRTLLENKVRNEVHEINHTELIERLKKFD